MASNLVIKVSADTKDAARKLKDLGYNVEEVKRYTDKATEAQNLWNKTLKKGTDDNIKQIVALGAKMLSFTAIATGAYRGIKSAVDEALKQNAEAKARIDEINKMWNNIKADLGKGLLDTVSPALDKLYTKLKEISDWADRKTAQMTIMDSLGEKGMTGQKLLDLYGKDTVTAAYEGWYGRPGLNVSQWGILNEANNLANGKDYNALYNQYKNGESTYVDKTGVRYNPQARPGSVNYVDPLAAVYEAEAYFQQVTAQEEEARRQLEAFYNRGVLYTAQARPGAGTASPKLSALYEAEARAEQLKKEEEEEKEHLEKMKDLRKDYYSEVRSMGMQSISSLTGAYTQSLQNQMNVVKMSSLSEEEKAKKLNQLGEKQFNAEKYNSSAEIAMSTAESIMNIWSKFGERPLYATSLTAMASTIGAAQLGAVLSQQYHPFAQGGIVSSPTHALIGEGGEKEAIMPLSKLQDFVTPSQGGTINITVNVADGTRGGSVAEDVYYAIERAQRTGLLPRWRYAS